MRIYFYSLNLNFNDFKVIHALSIKVGFVSGFSGSWTVPARNRLITTCTSHPAEVLRMRDRHDIMFLYFYLAIPEKIISPEG